MNRPASLCLSSLSALFSRAPRGGRPLVLLLLSTLLLLPGGLAFAATGLTPCSNCNDPGDPLPEPEPDPEPEPGPGPTPEPGPGPAPTPTPTPEPEANGGEDPDPLVGYEEALDESRFNGRSVGVTILDTCRTGANARGGAANQRFQSDCNLIVGGATEDPEGSSEALDQVSGEQINAQNSLAARAMALKVSMLRARLARARGGAGASGDDLSFGPLSVHFNARYLNSDADETELQPGYDTDGLSLIGGADWRFSDQLIAGVALNYADSDTDFALGRGTLDANTFGLSLYGSYNAPNGLFVDGLIGFENIDYSMHRRLNYTIDGVSADQVARSDPDGEAWNLNIGAGYTWYRDTWSITPSLRLNYLQTDVDAYSEHMSDPNAVGGGMALSMNGQTYTSFTTDLGVQVTRAISTGFGVIVPQLRVAWIHEFETDDERVGGRFLDDINAIPVAILTQGPASDYADISLGVSAQFANGRSAFLNYNTLLGYSDASFQAVSAGIRIEF